MSSTTNAHTVADRPRAPVKVDETNSIDEQADALLTYVFTHMSNVPRPTGLQHYDPRPTDVIITTFPKAGTTLLQNLTYHLLYLTEIAPHSSVPPLDTFSDISVIAPWLDYHPEHGTSLPTTTPRIFKTHSSFQPYAPFHTDAARAPRHILVVRSPLDYPASWLDFLFDGIIGDDCPAAKRPAVREAVFHAHVRRRLLPQGDGHLRSVGSWFDHTRDWLEPLRRNVFVLFYEDVVADLAATVRAIARFLRIAPERVTDAVVQRVAGACDRRVMAGDTRFRCGVEARAFKLGEAWKVWKEGREQSFRRYGLSATERAKVEATIRERLGYDSYDALRAGVKKAQREAIKK